MASIFWFIVLIGVLVFAHEAGHFLFAKLFHVRVMVFSLGFGGPVRIGRFKLSWQPGETEYRVAWFPLGGFVRLMGDDPTAEIAADDRSRAFLTQPTWKRFLIIFGGPLFSILLAVPTYFVYHLLQDRALAPVVGRVVAGSPAADAGIQAGDGVVSIGGLEIKTWEDVDGGIQRSGGESTRIVVQRGEEQLAFRVRPIRELDETGLELMGVRWDMGLRHKRQGRLIGVVDSSSPAAEAGLESWDILVEVAGVRVRGWEDIRRTLIANGDHPLPVKVIRKAEVQIGAITLHAPTLAEVVVQPISAERAPPGTLATGAVYTGIEPIDLYVQDVEDDYPAKKAGIEPGDKIVAIFDKPISSWEQFSRAMVEHADDVVKIRVRHEGQLREVGIKPRILVNTTEFKQTIRKPGAGVRYESNLAAGETIERPDRLLYALKMSVAKTAEAIVGNVRGFVRLFEGRVDPKEAFGGPIMILDMAGKMAAKGWDYFLNLLAYLSVLLGLLNLLPIPILDGGQIAFIAIEAIRRKPLSIGTKVAAAYVGLILLVSLMVFVFYADFSRYWEEIVRFFEGIASLFG